MMTKKVMPLMVSLVLELPSLFPTPLKKLVQKGRCIFIMIFLIKNRVRNSHIVPTTG